MLFPYATLRLSDKSENVTNSTSFVRQNIKSWNENDVNIIPITTINRQDKKLESETFSKSDGDISGALRLISSNDCIAPKNEETLNSLIQKHPEHLEPKTFPDSSIEID